MKIPEPDVLWHYSCAHSAPGIIKDGMLWPRPQIWLPMDVVWLTDLPDPDRDALGLTSEILTCDRTEYRVCVDPKEAEWWPVFARRVPRDVRAQYEEAGGSPRHWWVSERPVPVTWVTRLP